MGDRRAKADLVLMVIGCYGLSHTKGDHMLNCWGWLHIKGDRKLRVIACNGWSHATGDRKQRVIAHNGWSYTTGDRTLKMHAQSRKWICNAQNCSYETYITSIISACLASIIFTSIKCYRLNYMLVWGRKQHIGKFDKFMALFGWGEILLQGNR